MGEKVWILTEGDSSNKEQAVGLLGRACSVSLPTPTVFNGFKLRTGVAWD